MNSITLIGRLTRDPELSYTPNTQTAVCKFSLAVDRPRRAGSDAGVDYFRITTFGRLAENCDIYLAKGRQAAVEGRVETGSYKNRNGVNVNTFDVIAGNVEFLGGSNQQQSQPRPSAEEVQKQAEDLLMPEDNTQTQLGFDDMPDSFAAAEDDIPL